MFDFLIGGSGPGRGLFDAGAVLILLIPLAIGLFELWDWLAPRVRRAWLRWRGIEVEELEAPYLAPSKLRVDELTGTALREHHYREIELAPPSALGSQLPRVDAGVDRPEPRVGRLRR